MLCVVRPIDFYADQRRATSPETAFGATWHTQGQGPWTVTWLQATGELVAVRRGNDATATAPDDGEVVLLGIETDPRRLHATLTGWEDHVAESNGLAWLAARFTPPRSEHRRAGNAETTFGSTWSTQGDGPWHVVWMRETGELLAIKDGTAPARALDRAESDAVDIPAPVVVADPGEVVLIAVETDGDRLRAAMSGWEDHVGDANGLAWLAERFHAPVPPAGWYADPWSTRQLRWWDGTRWSHHTTKPVPTRWRIRSPASVKPRDPAPVFPFFAALGLIVGIVASRTLGGVVLHLVVDHLVRSWTIGALAFYVIAYGGIALTCIGLSSRYGSGRLTMDFGWRFQRGDVLRGPVVCVLTGLVAGPVLSPWVNNRGVQRGSELLRYSETHQSVAGAVILVVVAIVVAPLLEELAFRGVLLRSLTSWIGMRGAVVVQALCFGLYHFTPGLGGFTFYWMVGTALFGLGAGIAAARWRRLGPSIVAHATLNTLHLIAVLTAR
jgi:membrane protease YdiL (CAAX protease family)